MNRIIPFSFLLAVFLAGNITQASPREIPDIVAQNFSYGLDGRLYGMKLNTGQTTSLLALDLSDDSDSYDPITPFKAATAEAGAYASFPNTLVTRNGHLILASRPWAESNDDQTIMPGCPAFKRVMIDSEPVYSLVEGSHGAIIKYNPWAATPEERFIDLTSRFGAEICPNGIMALDAEDNIYFVSVYGEVAHQIYRIPASGKSGPVLLKTFVANATGTNTETASAEGYGPFVLKAGSAPDTLYGINARGGANGNGTIFRIQANEDENPVYGVLRHAKADEDGIMGMDMTIMGAFEQQGLLEYNNRLYYTTQAGQKPSMPSPNAFGTLSSIDLSATDTHASWVAHKSFADSMGMAAMGFMAPSDIGRPLGDLIAGLDHQFYGLLSSAQSNVLYRFDPENGQFTPLETLTRPASRISQGLNGKLYWYEEIMQGTNAGQAFLMEYDPGFTGPKISAFYTPTPELDWENNLTTTLLFWKTLDATSCTASGDWQGTKTLANASGETISLDASKPVNTFTLACSDGTHTLERTLQVTIADIPPAPSILDFRSDVYSITAGNDASFTLSWETENAVSCTIWRGGAAEHNIASDVVNEGSRNIAANTTGTREYRLICTGLGGDEVEWTPALSITVEAPTTKSKSSSSFSLLLLLPLGLLALRSSRRRQPALAAD